MSAALKMVKSEPRFIDPKAPLSQQIEMLNALRKNPPENSRRIKITPRLAEHILTNLNPHNRPRRTTSVTRYATDMLAGQWALTGDTIKFGKSGVLRDGQHRLAACIRANVPFETFCVFGIDDESFCVMDTGLKRKGDGAFAIASIKNANSAASATRWVIILSGNDPTNRSVTFQNRELLDAYNSFKQPLFDDCVAEAKILALKTGRVLHESALAAILYIAYQKNSRAAAMFTTDLREMKGGGKKLIAMLEKLRQQNMGRVHEVQRNAIIIRAFNCYQRKVPVTNALIQWNDTMDFPEIG